MLPRAGQGCPRWQSGHTHLLQGQLIRENALHVLILTRGVKVVGAYLKTARVGGREPHTPGAPAPLPLPSAQGTLGSASGAPESILGLLVGQGRGSAEALGGHRGLKQDSAVCGTWGHMGAHPPTPARKPARAAEGRQGHSTTGHPEPLTRSTAFLRLVSASVSSTKFSQRPRQSAGSPGRGRRCEPGAGATAHGWGAPGADLKGCLLEGREAEAAKSPAGTRGAHGDRARPQQSRTAEETQPSFLLGPPPHSPRPNPRACVPALRTGQAPESHGPQPVTEDHGRELLAQVSHPKLYPSWGDSPGHMPWSRVSVDPGAKHTPPLRPSWRATQSFLSSPLALGHRDHS